MKKYIFTFSLLLIFFTGKNYAQVKIIKGKVVAFKTYPVKNVKVSSKKLKSETTTDAQGCFSIESKKNDKLIFNAAGFQNRTVKIEEKDSLNINLILINNQNAFKDVVTQEHMKQSDLEYCVKNLMDENHNFNQMLTIFEVIQYVHPTAKITSVELNSTNGEDAFGTSGRQVILNGKGPNTILASPYALLVVDGIITLDISGINPEQVKNIKVLTGNESAHWGVQGGNGVVEITLNNE